MQGDDASTEEQLAESETALGEPEPEPEAEPRSAADAVVDDDFEIFLRDSGQLTSATDDGWMDIQYECDEKMYAMEAERIDEERARANLTKDEDIELEKEAFLLESNRAANLPDIHGQLLEMRRAGMGLQRPFAFLPSQAMGFPAGANPYVQAGSFRPVVRREHYSFGSPSGAAAAAAGDGEGGSGGGGGGGMPAGGPDPQFLQQLFPGFGGFGGAGGADSGSRPASSARLQSSQVAATQLCVRPGTQPSASSALATTPLQQNDSANRATTEQGPEHPQAKAVPGTVGIVETLIEALCQILEDAPTRSLSAAQAGGLMYSRVQAPHTTAAAKAAVKAAGGLGPFCQKHSSGRIAAQKQGNGQFVIKLATGELVIPGPPSTPPPPPPPQIPPAKAHTPSKTPHAGNVATARASGRPSAQNQASMPRASALQSKRPEMRVDRQDGKPYTHSEFRQQYGRTPSWPQQWESAEAFNVEQFKQTISRFVEELRSRWAGHNENVSFDRVMAGIRTQYKVQNFNELRAGPFWEVDALAKLQMLDEKINGKILAYVKVRSIGTLHDLEQSIVDDEEVSSFDKLRIGPLLKHPLVKQHFQPAMGVTVIPKVSVLDVIGQLRELMRRPKSRGHERHFDAEDLLSALASKLEMRGPLDLCCRISRHGIGMYITLISQVQMEETRKLGKLRKELERDSMKVVVRAKKALEKELKEDAQSDESLNRSWQDTVDRFTKHLAGISLEFDSTDGQLAQLIENMFRDGKVINDRVKVRPVDFKRLAALSAAYVTLRSSGDSVVTGHDILSELGMKPADIAETIEAAAKSVFSEMADMDEGAGNTASSLLYRVERASCAELGIVRFEAMRQGSFLSFLQAHQLDRRWGPLRLSSIQGETEELEFMGTVANGQASFLVPHEQVAAALDEMLRHADDDKYLALEEAICERFGVGSFKALGHGSLLQFMRANASLAFLLSLREGWTAVNIVPGAVEDFVHQAMRHCESCGTQLAPDALETCVSSYFQASLSQLGQPCADVLLQQISAERTVKASSEVVYWRACVGTSPAKPTDSAVGVLGWVEPESVIAALACAPILKNLEEHLLWDMAFAPSHGSLAAFLSVHKTPSCRIVEIEPNMHVRIFDASSAKEFRASCFEEDARGAVAHLLSIFVRAGHAQRDMLVTFASQALQKLGGTGSDRPVSFICSCLEAMPTQSVREILAPIFLEPLKGIVANFAEKMLELSNVNRTVLHHLGFKHGIEAWVEDFRGSLARTSVSSRLQSEQDVAVQSKSSAKLGAIQVTEEEVTDLEISKEAVPEEESQETSEESQEKSSTDVKHESHGDKPKPSADAPAAQRIIEEDRSAARAVIEEISRDPDLLGHRLMRAMEKISVELYSEKEHFVMELIQNADDNSYPAGGDPPAVEFVLSSAGMVIKNNEVGFTEANVRALCDVGGSTKGSGGSGYIGQKGIGFKSVFSVTDEPAIRSRGYSFCFKNYETESHGKNMLLPHWLDEDHVWTFDELHDHEDAGDDVASKWTTTIMLPFKSDAIDASKFNSIQPSLLLFLNKLRSITVTSEIEQRVMQRSDREDGTVEILHTDGQDLYLVSSKELQIDTIRRNEKATATRLECAFPLDKNQVQRPVYAFLPVASYGLRFIVQGDFIVSSSRETIVEDSPWNQWLRDEIADLFVDSLAKFKNAPGNTDLPCIDAFYSFVPLDGEVRGFFASTVAEIQEKLRASNCILTESGEWAVPSLCLLAGPQVRRLISDKQLMDALGMMFVHESIEINPALACHLGVETFSTAHLCAFIQEYAAQLDQQLSSEEEYVKFVAQSLYLLYQLDDQTQAQHKLPWKKRLSQLRFIPLVDGSRGRLEDRLFFPAVKMQDSLQNFHSVFQHEMPVVADTLCSVLGGEMMNQVVRKQLLDIGVKPLTAPMIVSRHVLPMLKRGADVLQAKPHARAIVSAYWGFLCVFYNTRDQKQQTELCEDLRDCALLPCVSLPSGQEEEQLLLSNAQGLHFSSQLGSKLDSIWPKFARFIPKLTGEDLRHFEPERCLCGTWKFVDPTLLDETNTKADNWLQFLGSLDVAHFAAVKKVRTPCRVLADGEKEILFDDYCCEELNDLIKTVTRSAVPAGDGCKGDAKALQTLTQISMTLDQLWDTYYKRAAERVLVNGSPAPNPSHLLVPSTVSIKQPAPPEYVDTSFRKLLLESIWLPAVELLDTTDVDSAERLKRMAQTFYKPTDLYMKNKATESVLAQHGRYLRPRLANEHFIDTLGIATSVSTLSLLQHLRDWASRPAFCTTVAHMTNVYHELLNRPTDDRVLEFFRTQACIFVPIVKGLPAKPTSETKGMFVKLQDCAWSDTSHVMDRAGVRILALHYGAGSNLEQVFEAVGLRSHPDLQDYVGAMAKMGQQSRETAVDDAANLLGAVGSMYQHALCSWTDPVTGVNHVQSLLPDDELRWSCLRTSAIFPSSSAGLDGRPTRFVKLQQLCVNDNHRLASMFKDAKMTTLRQHVAEKIVPRQIETDSLGPQELIDLLVQHDRRTDEDQLRRLRQELEMIDDVFFLHETAIDALRTTGLMDFLRIPSLAAEVNRDVVQGMMYMSTSAAPTVAKMIIFAQRYLHRVARGIYDLLIEQGIGALIHGLTVVVNEELSVVFTYQHHTRVTPQPCQLSTDHKYLFISRACIDDQDFTSISRELAKVFVEETREEFDPFATWLANTASNDSIGGADYTERQLKNFNNGVFSGIPQLENEEPVWKLPVSEVLQELQRTDSSATVEDADDALVFGEVEMSASERRAMRLKKLNEERQQQQDQEQPVAPPAQASWPANQPSVAGNAGGHAKVVVAWEGSTSRDAGIDPSLTGPAPVRVDPPPHLVTPEGVAAEVLQQAAAASGLKPPDSMEDPGLDVGGGHGVGGGGGRAPKSLTPEQLTHTVVSVSSGGTISSLHKIDASGIRSSESNGGKWHANHQWLPARLDGKCTAVNGHSSLAPLEALLPPPAWDQHSRPEWTERSTPLASPAELIALQAHLPPLDSDADTTAIGRWGEELVYRHLRTSGETLEWMNEHTESGLPYDILMQGPAEGPNGQRQPLYLEVKTTISASRHVFPISGQEISFAREHRSSYWVVRVYAGGLHGSDPSDPDFAVKMLKLEDPLCAPRFSPQLRGHCMVALVLA